MFTLEDYHTLGCTPDGALFCGQLNYRGIKRLNLLPGIPQLDDVCSDLLPDEKVLAVQAANSVLGYAVYQDDGPFLQIDEIVLMPDVSLDIVLPYLIGTLEGRVEENPMVRGISIFLSKHRDHPSLGRSLIRDYNFIVLDHIDLPGLLYARRS